MIFVTGWLLSFSKNLAWARTKNIKATEYAEEIGLSMSVWIK